MKVTDVARNALSACLVISADSTDIHSMRSVNGRSSSATFARSAVAPHADDDAIRVREDVDGLAEAQVLRRVAKADDAAL